MNENIQIKITPNSHAEHFLRDKPGSPEAVQRGCICPAAENNFGRGRSKGGVPQPDFATDAECPIHGFDALLAMLEEHYGPIGE